MTSTPGSGSANRAGPIGISGDAAIATPTAMAAPAVVTAAALASDSATRPGPAHAQSAQDREFGRVEDELTAQQLPDDGQRDQAGERGEDRQRGRLRPDRPLRCRVRGGQMDDLGVPHP